MEFTIGDALKSLRPDEKWSIMGTEIHWSADNATTQPTEAELNAELERLKKFSPKKRIPYYPPIGDQLDDGSWTFSLQINYFIKWIWFSASLMVLGMLLTIFKKKAS